MDAPMDHGDRAIEQPSLLEQRAFHHPTRFRRCLSLAGGRASTLPRRVRDRARRHEGRIPVRMLLYETCLSDIGIRSVRAFRQAEAAERWLDIIDAARNL
jgi:hypothetical protein